MLQRPMSASERIISSGLRWQFLVHSLGLSPIALEASQADWEPFEGARVGQ